jgi:hypothetical protein
MRNDAELVGSMVKTAVVITGGAIAIVALVVALVSALSGGGVFLVAAWPTWALIAIALVVPAYPPSERTTSHFVLWGFAGLLFAPVPVVLLAIRIARRRYSGSETAGARTPA